MDQRDGPTQRRTGSGNTQPLAPAPRVLVVEDSAATALLIKRALEADGLSVAHVGDLRSARARLAEDPPDVLVLEIELPDGSGLDLLREGASGPPIVILSSRHSELDRVIGLELGAEDYVVKPFYPRELATRVRRAAARRTNHPAHPSAPTVSDEVVVDRTARRVTVHGEPIELTTREFDLLAHLAAAPGRVFHRDELLRDVWKSSRQWQSPKTVNEHIRRLRHKIEDDPARPRIITTAGRSGYRFTPNRQQRPANI